MKTSVLHRFEKILKPLAFVILISFSTPNITLAVSFSEIFDAINIFKTIYSWFTSDEADDKKDERGIDSLIVAPDSILALFDYYGKTLEKQGFDHLKDAGVLLRTFYERIQELEKKLEIIEIERRHRLIFIQELSEWHKNSDNTIKSFKKRINRWVIDNRIDAETRETLGYFLKIVKDFHTTIESNYHRVAESFIKRYYEIEKKSLVVCCPNIGWENPNNVIENAKMIGSLFIKNFRFDTLKFCQLLDDEATLNRISQVIDSLKENEYPDNFILIYWYGIGTRIDSKYYLKTSDNGLYSMEDLIARLRRLGSEHILLILNTKGIEIDTSNYLLTWSFNS